MPIRLPTVVSKVIKDHLRSGCEHAEGAWEGGSDEEDSLTGALGSSLRIRPRKLHRGSPWIWGVVWKKFRGRGGLAEENLFGADGIFVIEATNTESGSVYTKGLLFQAKKSSNKDRAALNDQLRDMEDIAPGGSALVEYGPDAFRGCMSQDALRGESSRVLSGMKRLGDFLADDFLPCSVGLEGLYYEFERKTLIVPNETEGYRRIRAKVKNRILIEVRGPEIAN
jgi:hypothetical protein